MTAPSRRSRTKRRIWPSATSSSRTAPTPMTVATASSQPRVAAGPGDGDVDRHQAEEDLERRDQVDPDEVGHQLQPAGALADQRVAPVLVVKTGEPDHPVDGEPDRPQGDHGEHEDGPEVVAGSARSRAPSSRRGTAAARSSRRRRSWSCGATGSPRTPRPWRSRRRSARPARGGRCPVPRPARRSPRRRRGGRPPPRAPTTRPCPPDEDSGTCSSFSIFSAAPGRPPRRPGRAPGPRAGWAPPRHTACSRRVRSRPPTLMRTRRPVARSSRIACAPRAAGPAPAATADRTAAVLDSSRAGAAVSSPSSARSRTVRVPDPGSRTTSGVAARVAAVTRRPERWAQGWPGPTTTTSVSVPTRRCCRSSGASGPSTKPRSTSPAATSVATRSLFVAVMVTSVGTWPSCA